MLAVIFLILSHFHLDMYFSILTPQMQIHSLRSRKADKDAVGSRLREAKLEKEKQEMQKKIDVQSKQLADARRSAAVAVANEKVQVQRVRDLVQLLRNGPISGIAAGTPEKMEAVLAATSSPASSLVRKTDGHQDAVESSMVQQPATPQPRSISSTPLSPSLPQPSFVVSGPARWKEYTGYDGDPLASWGYNDHSEHPFNLETTKRDCERAGVAAFTRAGGWTWFHKFIVDEPSRWKRGNGVKMWVNHAAATPVSVYDKQYNNRSAGLSPYGCSRHKRSCAGYMNHTGTAPCCTAVMKEIVEEMSRTLRRHGIHFRITSGAQLSLKRDGQLQFFDHDFDPVFEAGKMEEAKRIIAEEMHLGGQSTKWRDAQFFYTRRVASRLKTDWSKYFTIGGDYSWGNPKFHDEWALQLNPTFIDIGQVNRNPPTRENTMLCHPELDALCLRDWFSEAQGTGRGSDIYKPPSVWVAQQLEYGGYWEQIARPGRRYGGAMFRKDKTKKNADDRRADVQEMLARFPDYWERGNN